MAAMRINDVKRIYRVNPTVIKKTIEITKEERQKVVDDCLDATPDQKREYGRAHGFSLNAINYFLYHHRSGKS